MVLEKSDIKKILAEHYKVDEKDVQVMQYSFVIMLPDDKEVKENEEVQM